ncbi:MAG: hypothetical protein P8H03_09790 [Emcibacteraceae bacterium]|nr:hypothetical protein [Emcibacteraceae bacterium]
MKRIIFTTVILVAMSITSSASAAGIGLAISINSKGQIGLGPRVFTSKIAKKIVGSAGVNYNFTRKEFEPIGGIGYTLDNTFLGVEASYRLKETSA